jgi:hypothetical protein
MHSLVFFRTCTETFGVRHFDYKNNAKPEEYEEMWQRSPISHVDKVNICLMTALAVVSRTGKTTRINRALLQIEPILNVSSKESAVIGTVLST